MTHHRALLTAVAVVGAALPATASAAPRPVTSGALVWTMSNVYETGAPENTNRTWMGYTTSVGPPFAGGTVASHHPATGQNVTPSSPRGAGTAYSFRFPVAAGGTYDAATGTGRIELAGTVSFTSRAHGFAITVSNPLVVLDNGRAQLFASGSGASGSGQASEGGRPYDRSRPVFDLALGERTDVSPELSRLTGIAPAIATADMVWPGGSYPAGAGPDRTPNTFGGFALEIGTADAKPPAEAPKPGTVTQPRPKVARPKVRCKAVRTKAGRRTRCEISVDAAVRRIVVRAGTKRLRTVAVRAGLARVDLPRRRRTLTFVATDAKGRELSRRVQTVGSR